MAVLRAAADLQNQHLMGWGASNPEPRPGQFQWQSLDQRIALIRRSNGDPVLTLCCAPDWMKGGKAGRTDWKLLEVAPTPDHYDDFAALAARAALRYPDIRYFQVWNELKGFWDPVANTWDARAYTDMYNRVYDAIKAVRPDALIGGPYVVVDSWSESAVASHPSEVRGPWGILDQRPLDVLEYWFAHAHGADFVTVDGETATRDRGLITDAFTATQKFTAVDNWLRARTTLPIWWAEWYASVPPGKAYDLLYQNAVGTAALRQLALSGSAVALSWQPQGWGEHCLGCLWSDVNASSGGQATPFAATLTAWRKSFPPGTLLHENAGQLPDGVLGLASRTQQLLINSRYDLVVLPSRAGRLSAHEVRFRPLSPHPFMSVARSAAACWHS
jgi:hypothetical protein